jgi:subtilisin family serine protease
MNLKTVQQFLKFFTLSLILAACAKQENLEIAKKNYTLGEDQLAPVYKANNVPADLQDSYIVVFKDDVDVAEIDGESERMCGGGKARKERTFKHAVKGFSGRMTDATIEEFRRNPRVKYIEQNQVVKIVATQSSATWGIDRIDQVILPLSTTYTYNNNGSTVDAYIFDTGVRSDHVEFSGRMLPGYNAFTFNTSTNDLQGHGTHVAGTVGGTVYGVAKGVSIIPVKVLDDTGSGTFESVIGGLDWAVGNHTTKPAVGNMSLGGGASTALDDAVRRCVADGIVMAVAAGNDNRDVNNALLPTSPARVREAITVGSTTSTDARSSFSNYGSVVDIFAPGSAILSASYLSTTGTATLSGTSMASPHVAGAAALFLEYAPGSTPSQVEAGLKQFAAVGRITGLPTGTANNLLQINFGTVPSLPAPSVPTLSSPTNGATNQSLTPTLTWLAATAATSYNLQVSTASNFSSPLINATGITTTSRAISGLANSTTYYWRVSSTNTTSTSAWSAVRSFTTAAPLAVPTAPTLRSPAANATNVSRTPALSWNAATRATTYEVQVSTDPSFNTSIAFGRSGLTARNITVTPQLGSRVLYYWRVRGANTTGPGTWSTVRSFTTVL